MQSVRRPSPSLDARLRRRAVAVATVAVLAAAYAVTGAAAALQTAPSAPGRSK